MKKKLPGIYKGKVKNNSNQKQSTFSIIENKIEKRKQELNEELNEGKSVDRQIKDIFSSVNYVYKADVQINMIDGETLKKTIIGRTNNSLITIDDELIDVSKISKIDFLN